MSLLYPEQSERTDCHEGQIGEHIGRVGYAEERAVIREPVIAGGFGTTASTPEAGAASSVSATYRFFRVSGLRGGIGRRV